MARTFEAIWPVTKRKMKEQKIEDCNSTLIEFQFNYINVIETGTSQTNPPNRTDIWTHNQSHTHT